MTTDNVIRAFGADHVITLTGLSKGQLSYWDKTGFFSPRYAAENRRSPFSRIYSFSDVIGLRVISILRKQYNIPLQKLRSVAKKLSQYKESPWSEITLFMFGKEVHFREPETGQIRGVFSNQYVENLPLRSVVEDITEKSNKLKERTKEQFGQIVRHRFTVHNAWVVAGTRIPVAAIHRFKQAGYGVDKIIREYPSLTKKMSEPL